MNNLKQIRELYGATQEQGDLFLCGPIQFSDLF